MSRETFHNLGGEFIFKGEELRDHFRFGNRKTRQASRIIGDDQIGDLGTITAVNRSHKTFFLWNREWLAFIYIPPFPTYPCSTENQKSKKERAHLSLAPGASSTRSPNFWTSLCASS